MLDYRPLVEALREMFRVGCVSPVRHHHQIGTEDGPEATLLLMPAWQVGEVIGIKIATVFPSNAERDLPGVQANYLLLDGTTGEGIALLDGAELTARRTACASALAADYLARPDARTLLVVGTGTLSTHLARAHCAVRDIAEVRVWGRRPERARAVADALAADGMDAAYAPDLEDAVRAADVVSCATLSTEPLVHGAWLRPGQHLDLVGAFRPDMREADDDAIRAATVFVDTRDGALAEGGDVVQPVASGVLDPEAVLDLFDLTRSSHPGRTSREEITLFKSVGTALEDLAAARLAVERLAGDAGEA